MAVRKFSVPVTLDSLLDRFSKAKKIPSPSPWSIIITDDSRINREKFNNFPKLSHEINIFRAILRFTRDKFKLLAHSLDSTVKTLDKTRSLLVRANIPRVYVDKTWSKRRATVQKIVLNKTDVKPLKRLVCARARENGSCRYRVGIGTQCGHGT